MTVSQLITHLINLDGSLEVYLYAPSDCAYYKPEAGIAVGYLRPEHANGFLIYDHSDVPAEGYSAAALIGGD